MSAPPPKKRRQNWSKFEEDALIKIYRDRNICSMLDSKSLKAATIYDIVVKDLEKLGIVRTATQVQQKWQSLRKIHRAGKSVNGTSGEKGIDTDQDV